MKVFIKCVNCDKGFRNREVCIVCDGEGGSYITRNAWDWSGLKKPKLRLHHQIVQGQRSWYITWQWYNRTYRTWSYFDVRTALDEATAQMIHEFQVQYLDMTRNPNIRIPITKW